MTRRTELTNLIKDNKALLPMVDDLIFLECQLEQLRKLPMIKIHPDDPNKQKATPAAKQYKEMLQQYTNLIKVFMRATGTDEEDDESPLRKWMNEHTDQT